jgi:Zn-dependent M16 (insulinase) family peptidase
MNAFTSSDWTAYPFATRNEKDYFGLLDVYLDAVFFPKLDPLSFAQEGHRFEYDGDILKIKWIVYNEMKWVYADHSSTYLRGSQDDTASCDDLSSRLRW